MKAKSITAVFFCLVILITCTNESNACTQYPEAILTVNPEYVMTGVTVTFNGSSSYDPDGGGIKKYEWDFDGNGTYDYYETSSYHPDGAFDGITTHTYNVAGIYTAKLRVTDNDAAEGGGSDKTDTDIETVYVNVIINVPSDINTIQGAIDAAIDGSTVIVSQGTYYEDVNFVGKAITLTSADPNDWSVVAATIIDGCDVNSVVSFTSGEDANTIISGLTITNGYGDVHDGFHAGGGILCGNNSNPTIRNCIIAGNSAEDGGGIACYGASPEIINCFIIDNTAQYTGGICCWGGNPTITSCVIAGNSADSGGGIGCWDSSSTITNCTFSGNSADYGGGMYNDPYGGSAEPKITNCIFWADTAATSGDEIYNEEGADPNFSYCDIKGCGGSNNWDELNFGTDGGGNIDSDPCFININDIAGPDGIYGTRDDDGLRLQIVSPCIDNADGDYASAEDITGHERVDVIHVEANGIGEPNYVDMGAYESSMIWFVDVNATGNYDGSSWANACNDLQIVLADANYGHEIWVAEGTYYPTSGSNREVSFELPEGVELYGGFDGTETFRYQRDWVNNITTLSGDIGTPVDSNDNSYRVVYIYEADGVVVDGFTISDAKKYSGMSSVYSAITVNNCVFENNCGIAGGGLYFYGDSATIVNCIFSNNYAEYEGGGVSIYDCHNSTSLTNCVFVGNSTYSNEDYSYGGGLYIESSSPTVLNCTFYDNYADKYGGAIFNQGGQPKIINCILWDNEAGNDGNEIYNYNYDSNISYSDIKGCGGSGAGWDLSLGTDASGNIDSNPLFVNVKAPAGSDNIWGTIDDGLRILGNSLCVDAANGDAAPSVDILSIGRIDMNGVNNTGAGDPNYVDIGAYESGYDYDSDGIPDEWEVFYGLNPKDSNDADLDTDEDNLTNLDEYLYETNPADSDSDSDCMPDGWEVDNWLDPLTVDGANDLDEDTYSNIVEYIHGSDPNNHNNLPEPTTISVPSETSTIQQAIDWSINGDVIEVSQGIYYESINFNGKTITLKNADPNNWSVIAGTIIDANNSDANVVTFNSGEDANSVLRGFTLTGGSHGVFCGNSSSGFITRCIIEDNASDGIYCVIGSPEVTSNIIRCNNGYGIRISDVNSIPVIRSNFIHENQNGIAFNDANSLSVVWNNNIVYNDGNGVYVGSAAEPNIKNCILWGNSDDLYNCNATFSCIEDGNAGVGNVSSDPCFANSFIFCDQTQANGTTTTIIVNDASLYEIDDTVEYNNDGVARIVTEVNTTTNAVTFDEGLDTNSLAGTRIRNWGPYVNSVNEDFHITVNSSCLNTGDPDSDTDYAGEVDIDGEPRARGVIDIGADEIFITVWYVDCDASGAADGTSWEDAFKTIQAGINAASEGDFVFVAEGTYEEHIDFKGKAITLSGTNPDDPCVVNATILDVSSGEDGITIDESEDANTVMAGFKVIGDCMFGDLIRCSGTSPTFKYCVFADNMWNGGINISNSSSLLISNCNFVNFANWAISCSNGSLVVNHCDFNGNGEGINCSYSTLAINDCNLTGNNGKGINSNYSSLTVTNSVLKNNKPNAIYGTYGSAKVTNCTIAEHKNCNYGIYWDGGTLEFSDCNIVNNDSGVACLNGQLKFNNSYITDNSEGIKSLYGNLTINGCFVSDCTYGIYQVKGACNIYDCNIAESTIAGILGEDLTSAYISNCDITNNGNYSESWGINCSGYKESSLLIITDCNINNNNEGVKCFDFKSAEIKDCEINNNKKRGLSLSSCGSAWLVKNCEIFFNATGITIWQGTPAVITNCLIAKNNYGISHTGNSHSVVIQNSTIYGNGQKGITGYSCDVIKNCILWANGSVDMDGCSAIYSCVEDGASGAGNLSVDPCFVNADQNDFHLRLNSICIDAGAPGSDYSQEPSPNGNRVNIGAYGNTGEAAITIDTDGDTICDNWELYRWPGDDPNQHGPNDDTDGDGLKEIVEYHIGWDPNEDNSSSIKAFVLNADSELSYPSIQSAMNCALTGQTVVVPPGRHYENIYFPGSKITVTSQDPNNSSVVASTIIDGNDANNVVVFDAADSNSILSGLTITGGHQGIYCCKSSPTISKCVIKGNGCNPEWTSQRGGGIFCTNFASPAIKESAVLNNEIIGGNGGGMYCTDYAYPIITDCLFSLNFAFSEEIAGGNGGGIYFTSKASATINNTIFNKNYALGAGGGIYSDSVSISLINSVFSGNYAQGSGGAIYGNPNSVISSTFSRNYSSNSGGGIWTLSTSLLNCIFWDNMAVNDGNEIYGSTNVKLYYCCIKNGIENVYGSPNDTGGNIDSNPNFIDANNPLGPDGLFGTYDDGLSLRIDSSCIDSADGNISPSADILDANRTDIPYVENIGIGNPDYADIGAYEMPAIWFVDANAPADGNGYSWSDAFDEFNSALSCADNGDEIWVAKGTYKPTDDSNRDISFELAEGVRVLGGFNGNELNRNQRDWIANKTILSGDVGTANVQGDNSYHVVIGAERALLDGFTITGGCANGTGTNNTGGALYCYEVSPTIRNCMITENKSQEGYGGAIYLKSSSAIFDNCFLVNNFARAGGVIYADSSQFRIVNCVLADNMTDEDGGVIYDFNSSPTLVNCTFSNNSAFGYGGAIYNNGSFSEPFIVNCILWGNTAEKAGDEIYNCNYAMPSVRHSNIKGTGGSIEWDPDFGVNLGGNMDGDPCFFNVNNPDGNDEKFGTIDDGLRITLSFSCVDSADASMAPLYDVIGSRRVDIYEVDNKGNGVPDYVDIGAYELNWESVVVAICWIDESTEGYHNAAGEGLYKNGLRDYQDLINFQKYILVKNGCLAPLPSGQPGTIGDINDILPLGYSAPNDLPELINIEECNRPPTLDELIDDFYRICNGSVPDYLILSVDNSGSMTTDTIQDAYGDFVDWVKENYPNTIVYEREFTNERWIHEMVTSVELAFEDYTLHYQPSDDFDGDGMPNGWEENYGFDPNDPTDADDDYDNDGYSNLKEYLGGTDPTDNSDYPSVTAEPLPYFTSFEGYQGFEWNYLDYQNNWEVEAGTAIVWRSLNDDNREFQWVFMGPGTIISKTFNSECKDDEYIRCQVIAEQNAEVLILNQEDIVAGIKFDDDFSIDVLNNGTYINTGYTWSYDDDWTEVKFVLNYESDDYIVSYDGNSIADANFDDNYSTLTKIKVYSGNVDWMGFDRISITGESTAGGTIGNKDDGADIYISYPCACDDDVELRGRIPIKGAVWWDSLGLYEIYYCPVDSAVDAGNFENWRLADSGYEIVPDGGTLGYWDTSSIPNGYYYLGIVAYDDTGYSDSGLYVVWTELYIGEELVYDGPKHFPVVGDLKCNTFYHEENPDISVPWQGQFPFELKRIYNNNNKLISKPLRNGWTHNGQILLVEDSTYNWEKIKSGFWEGYPTYDEEMVAFGYIWITYPDGSKKLFHHTEGYYGGGGYWGEAKYVPFTNYNTGEYIIRKTYTDTDIFINWIERITYKLYQRDGMVVTFDTGDIYIEYANALNYGSIFGKVTAPLAQISDRFGNTLEYTWNNDKTAVESISDGKKTIQFDMQDGYYTKATLKANDVEYRTVEFDWDSENNIYKVTKTGYGVDVNGNYDANNLKEYAVKYKYDGGLNLIKIAYTGNIAQPSIEVQYDGYNRVELRKDYFEPDNYLTTNFDYILYHPYSNNKDISYLKTVADNSYKVVTSIQNDRGNVIEQETSTSDGSTAVDVNTYYKDTLENPLKPTDINEFFDGVTKRTWLDYSSEGDLIEQKVYPAGADFTCQQTNYHTVYWTGAGSHQYPLCAFIDNQTSWQGLNKTDQKVQKQYIYGEPNGTIDQNDGMYLVQEKTLLAGDPCSQNDVWATTGYEYYENDTGLIRKKTDPNGFITFYEYDNNNYEKFIKAGTADSNAPIKRFYYDAIGQLRLESNHLGGVTLYDYDDFGRVWKVRTYDDAYAMTINDADFVPARYENSNALSTTIYGYNERSNNTYEKQPAGGETYTEFTISGSPQKTTYNDGTYIEYSYDNRGLKTQQYSYDANTAQDWYVTFGYDSMDRPNDTCWYDYNDTTIAKRKICDYWGSGNKKCVDIYGYGGVLEKQTNYYYDALGRTTSVITALGTLNLTTSYSYDAIGNRTAIVEPNGNILYFDYDNANRKITEYFAAAPGTQKSNAIIRETTGYYENNLTKDVNSYDYNGDLLARSEFEYDPRSRITKVSQDIDDVNKAETFYDYSDSGFDVNGLSYHIKITDAGNNITYIALDAFERRVEKLFPTGDYERFEYNGDGSLAAKSVFSTGADPCWIEYFYDDYGRLTDINYPDSGNIHYAYDGFGRKIYTKDNRNANDNIGGTHRIDYSYDTLGRIISVIDQNDYQTDYTYTADGQKTSIVVYDPSSETIYNVRYDYDDAGRLEYVTEPLLGSDDYIAKLQYDDNGNLSQLKYFLTGEENGAATSTNYTYNRDNSLVGYQTIGGPTFKLTDVNIDGLGRLLYADETLTKTNGSTITYGLNYTYDRLSQLTFAENNGVNWQAEFRYNKNGDISSRTIQSGTTEFSYDGHQLIEGIGSEAFTLDYDDNGNMTATASAVSIYNWDGKLRQATSGGKTVSLKYDPEGNRIYRQSSQTGTQRYILDITSEPPSILLEIDVPDETIAKTYIYADGRIIAQHDGSYQDDIYFYLLDRLGSVRQIIDANADVKNRYTFKPFGQAFLPQTEQYVTNPFRFTSQYYDNEISQYYYHARQYDPLLYRFTSNDPVDGEFTEPLTLSVYLYCRNNPINLTDPTGKFFGLISAQSIVANARAKTAAISSASLGFAQNIIVQAQYYHYRLAIYAQRLARGGTWTNNLRQNMIEAIGKVQGAAAHHVLPKQFELWFKSQGIKNIHDPMFGMWIDPKWHALKSYEYNQAWRVFIDRYPKASPEQILKFAKEISESIMQCPTFIE